MKNVLFIHGLGASGDTVMGEFLDSLNDDKLRFHHPDFSAKPGKAMEEVDLYIVEHHIDLVIGMSIGGFYALCSKCDYGVVINPVMTPVRDLVNTFGFGSYLCADGRTVFTMDRDFYRDLEGIIASRFPGETEETWFKTLKGKKRFAGIFGAEDELFSHYDDFMNVDDRLMILLNDMGHPFDLKYINLLRLYAQEIANHIAK